MTFKGYGIISHGIINGNPVWRTKTAEEVLLEELSKNEKNNMIEKEVEDKLKTEFRNGDLEDRFSDKVHRCPKCGDEVLFEDGLCSGCV